jgi:hypothetical protein
MSAASIRRALERHKTFLDFTRDDLGLELCRIATDGAQECILLEQSPDGSPWPPLSEEYAKWKSKHYPGEPMGVRDLLMADHEEVQGVVEVEPTRCVVTYGKSEAARDEATWFQARRPFWGFTEQAKTRAVEHMNARLKVIRG